MMKERLEEIACVVVGLPAASCEWLKCKNRPKFNEDEMEDWKFLVND